MSSEYILETQGLTKEFAGFVAVSDVNLRVRRGSIHALIGPNGAGKTTCFNLLTKFLMPSQGQILYKGQDITAMAPADVARLGLVRSFQISAVFPHLTALENVRVALQREHGSSFDFWRSKSVLDRFNGRARQLLDDVGLSEFANTPAVEMPYGRKRALEIATTLALDPEMMLLDEPMAGMGHEDIDKVAALIKRISEKYTILMVEHNLNVVANLSDTITVLTRGKVLAEGNYRHAVEGRAVKEAYLGAAMSNAVLNVKNLEAWYGESTSSTAWIRGAPGEVVTRSAQRRRQDHDAEVGDGDDRQAHRSVAFEARRPPAAVGRSRGSAWRSARGARHLRKPRRQGEPAAAADDPRRRLTLIRSSNCSEPEGAARQPGTKLSAASSRCWRSRASCARARFLMLDEPTRSLRG